MKIIDALEEVIVSIKAWADKNKVDRSTIGNMSDLQTKEKSNIVSAINEVAANGDVPIIVDPTLAIEGEAADAKAVGDALAGKQPIGNYALDSDIPQVPDWALAATKPAYTASEVGALPDDTVIPSLDGYATETYVSDTVDVLPIVVADDGYTDLIGLRRLKNWEIIEQGSTITLNYTLEGDESHTDVITFDENGYPTSIVADGFESVGSWTVVEEAATDG